MIRFTDFVSVVRARPDDPRTLCMAATAAVAATGRGASASLVFILDAAELAAPGALDAVDAGPPFRPLAELLAELREKDGQVCVAAACLVKEDVDPQCVAGGVEIITTEEMVDLLMQARGSLQLT